MNNREIKFRAHDGSNWWVGLLVFHGSAVANYAQIIDRDTGIISDNAFTDSVGQYTGLKDKNGKEIYEGDLVRHVAAFFIPLDDGSKDMELVESEDVGSIVFDHGSFMFVTPEDPPRLSVTLWPGVGGLLSEDERYDFEVIGNIYENPELLSNE